MTIKGEYIPKCTASTVNNNKPLTFPILNCDSALIHGIPPASMEVIYSVPAVSLGYVRIL